MNKAYFYLLKGMIAMKRNEYTDAEMLMQKSYDIGLPTDNDKGMVLFNLAQLNYNKRKFNAAKIQLRQVKELDIKEPMLLEQVGQLENALKARPGGRQQMMHRGMGGGRGQRMIQQQPGQKKSNNRKASSKRKKKK